MKRKNIAVIGIMVIFTVLLLTGCETLNNFKANFTETDEDTDAVIRIGVFQPLSGPYQRYGELERRGIELAHELFPTALGKDIELVMADNRSDMQIAEAAIQHLITRNPAIVLGSYGEIFSLIAAEFLEEAQIPAIAITNTNWLVTSNNPFYFRVSFTSSFEGVAMAAFAVEEMGARTAAILKPENDDLAISVSHAFSDTMIRLTENEDAIVSSQTFDPDAEDIRLRLMRIRGSGAEVVFMPSSIENAAEILIQARELGLEALFLGTSMWDNPELIELAGEAAEGIAFSTIFDPDAGITQMTEVFLNAYREKYGEYAVPHSSVALAFDAYLVAISAIVRARTTDGIALVSALSDTRELPGAAGSITFNDRGDPIKSVVIVKVLNGEIAAAYTVDPDLEEDIFH
jgi:branched-chain amino acid transport system substrate-binding protein